MKGLRFNDSNVSQDMQMNAKRNDFNKPVVVHFYALASMIWSKNHNANSISPRGMISSIKRVGKQFKPFRQEDAHEYLRQLLDCMHEEVLKANRIPTNDPKLSETTFISRIFGGYLCNTLSCPKCKYTSKTFNHFQDISLDINDGINSVNAAVQAFVKPEYLSAGNEWQCDKCKARVKVMSSSIRSFFSNSKIKTS